MHAPHPPRSGPIAGRGAPLLSARRGRWIVGVDIGGTNVAVGLVPFDGGPVSGFRKFPTKAGEGPEPLIRRIAAAVRDAIHEGAGADPAAEGRIAGLGIGSPGPLDRERGVVLTTPNLGWRDFPLRSLLAEATGLDATLDNDANCATYGEWWLGAGRGARALIGLTLGTGIGGGIVLEGELFHGVSDAAAEFGHMTIHFAGRRCSCGNRGCLEAYASGPNIAARAVEGLHEGVVSILPDLVEGDLGLLTAAHVSEGALRGDAFAAAVLSETARLLGAGVANLVNAFNPDRIVIAGGVTRAGDLLFEPLREEVRRRAFRPAWERCRIVPWGLVDTAGVVGAAAVFRRVRFGSLPPAPSVPDPASGALAPPESAEPES